MAGYENIKDKGFDKRSTEELRLISSNGGKASGEARRRKADFRKTLNMLLTAKIDSEEWTPLLGSLGLDSTLESALNMAMIKKGLAGDVKAFEAIAKYSGQSTQTLREDEEQDIRIARARKGNTDSSDESIQAFLKAMKPTQEDLDSIFDESEEENIDGEEAEETI